MHKFARTCLWSPFLHTFRPWDMAVGQKKGYPKRPLVKGTTTVVPKGLLFEPNPYLAKAHTWYGTWNQELLHVADKRSLSCQSIGWQSPKQGTKVEARSFERDSFRLLHQTDKLLDKNTKSLGKSIWKAYLPRAWIIFCWPKQGHKPTIIIWLYFQTL